MGTLPEDEKFLIDQYRMLKKKRHRGYFKANMQGVLRKPFEVHSLEDVPNFKEDKNDKTSNL